MHKQETFNWWSQETQPKVWVISQHHGTLCFSSPVLWNAVERLNMLFPYLDDLAWYKRQLLSSRLMVWWHGSRVVRVQSHKQSDSRYGHLARSLELPFPELLWCSNPHLIWKYQNIQTQTCLHLQQQQQERPLSDRPLGRQMASVDGRPVPTFIPIWSN